MWTDARKETFKKLYNDNLSFSRIAAELGGFEHCKDGGRNACIGQAHRLGLDPRPWTDGVERRAKAPRFSDREAAHARRATAMRMKNKAKRSFVSVEATPPPEPEYVTTEHMMTFMQLENHNCRYALFTGDEPFEERFFCGTPTADVADGRPYCSFHARICFQPRMERKPRPYIPGMVAAE